MDVGAVERVDRLIERTLVRYLAIAHFGRGRGEFEIDEEPQRWRTAVAAAVRRDAEGWSETWKNLARQAEPRPADTRQGDFSPSSEMIRLWLDRAARSTLLELYPLAARRLEEEGEGRALGP